MQTRSSLQLSFIAALCIATRLAMVHADVLASLQTLASQYPAHSLEDMEQRMLGVMLEADAAGRTKTPYRVPLPAEPPGILARFGLGPSGGAILPPDIEVTVLTTATSLLEHLLQLLPSIWVVQVEPLAHKALVAAMKVL